MTVSSQVKQTLASIKGAQSTLKIYAAQTQSDETRLAYEDAIDKTGDIIRDLEKRVQTLEYQEPQYKGF
ncbi:DUF1657 domain-containing protein [Petroclostridium sp. X23]|jgi:hypothetical protein|uniref:DUF1657 domain-containing protein n=1 Tax=Petroclostridium sp. X23 TaxID=3045146 RepID=UPI0024ACB1DB|nr:DUF1657 domain-containing protein [Petroclostridium sp. X23]WHH60043.1 DUF1657 domain-containing protein [Petroclostridium sp. X23]